MMMNEMPHSMFIRNFSKPLEDAFASGDNEKVQKADTKLERASNSTPNMATDVFNALAQSDISTSRLAAGRNIAALVNVRPEVGATIWLRLLGDKDIEVARQAYNSFNGYCYDVEHGLKGEDPITPMSRALQAMEFPEAA